MQVDERLFDLIVVGAGIAGLATASTAVEHGLSVCLVEKQPEIGGSSAMSGGWLAFSETPEQRAVSVEDSHELFRQDLLEVGGHLNDEDLVDAYLRHQGNAYKWLKSKGIEFSAVEISSGQSAPRGHLSDIKEVLATLFSEFIAAGGQAHFSTQAQRLIVSDDKVTGVQVEQEGVAQRLSARYGVVLTTGGFSRGEDLLRIFAPEQLAALPFGGPGNTGDGLKMAMKVGAGLADMSFISATYGSHPETTDEGHELLTAYYSGAVIVNTDGDRFIDESKSYKTLGTAVLEQEDGLGFQIFDAKIRAQSQPGVPLMDIDALEDKGRVYSADSIEALAVKIGLDPQALVKTVRDYNQMVAGEQEDVLGRSSLCNGVGEPVFIDTAPFYAYPAKALMTSTYCGLKTDPNGAVLDVFSQRINGLYAAGELMGGFHGAAYMTGTSLGKGLIFGHHIARTIATQLDQEVAHSSLEVVE